jgi:hypothetical protein
VSTGQHLVTHVVEALALLALVGIIYRQRAHLCWSFVAYLVTVLVYNGLVAFWPDRFFKAWTWILAHGLFDALKMGIAVELGYRIFQAFPGAAATARRTLFTLLFLTSVALIGIPVATTYGDVVLEWQPRVLTGTIWIMNGLAILITWYRVPVHAYHKRLLLGFVPYLLLFTTVLSLLREKGWGILPYVQAAEPAAYMLLMAFWAWSSWRTDKQPDASPALVRMLQPWRVGA